MKQYKTALAIFIIALFSSCEKVITIDLKNAAPVIVIEGIIDNSGNPAKVTISKSVSFSAGNTYPPVTGAVVKVADNLGNNFMLNESSSGIYTNTALIGAAGKSYTLTINAEGKNYTSTCKMPPQVSLDSIYQDTIIITKQVVFTTAKFNDPTGFGNNYQFIETINGKHNKTIFILDDSYQDGAAINNQLIDDDAPLKAGDTVQVEMRCVDKSIYHYLAGLSDLQGGNTVPANPESNISNNALGYFSAHTSQKKTIVIR